jgi:crotonobetainyl-CoA:carnitine CoA-transferase CaiB-like acyl-CoA transferase
MALNGEANTPPLKFGVAVVDMMTGMYAAQAVLAALFRRTRTGKGRHIEMALYDCGLMITGYYGLDALLLGHDPQRYGNAHPSIVPYGMYDAADGPLIIAVGNNASSTSSAARSSSAPTSWKTRALPPMWSAPRTAWCWGPCSRS